MKTMSAQFMEYPSFLVLALFVLTFGSCSQERAIEDTDPQVSETHIDEGQEWNTREVVPGVTWLNYLAYDSRFDSEQSYNAIVTDLDNAEVDVEFLWFRRTAILSMIANQV